MEVHFPLEPAASLDRSPSLAIGRQVFPLLQAVSEVDVDPSEAAEIGGYFVSSDLSFSEVDGELLAPIELHFD
jgi:hypothetical protein